MSTEVWPVHVVLLPMSWWLIATASQISGSNSMACPLQGTGRQPFHQLLRINGDRGSTHTLAMVSHFASLALTCVHRDAEGDY